MKRIIAQLYDGDISAVEQIVSKDPEYWPLIQCIDDLSKKLYQNLGQEAQTELKNLASMYSDQMAMECYESFSYGLKLGTM